jgi:hypothetical protein
MISFNGLFSSITSRDFPMYSANPPEIFAPILLKDHLRFEPERELGFGSWLHPIREIPKPF